MNFILRERGLNTNGMQRFKLLLVIANCLLSTGLLAQTVDNDTIIRKHEEVAEVKVQGQSHRVSIGAASPTQKIDKEQMLRVGATQISDAVKHLSGVNVKDYGGIGGLKTVSVRSLGAQHTAVNYDGITVSDCQSGQVDLSRFSFSNISELELTIGQGNDIFQPAKIFASAGVLTIKSTAPKFEEQNYHIDVNINGGSFGLVNPSAIYSQKLTKRLAMSLYADYQRADGNYTYKMYNGNKLIKEKRNNSDIQAYRGELNLYSQLGDNQELNGKIYLYHSKRGLPGGVIYDNPYSFERLHDKNYFAQINYENRFNGKWKLKANGKFNYSWSRDINGQTAVKSDDRFKQTESYGSVVAWHNFGRGFSASLAQDFSYNYLSTTLKNCQYPERYTSLTALAVQFKSNEVLITASLLNTYITENVKVGSAADDRKRISPAVSLSWKPLKQSEWHIRASYKDIFRAPTFNDLYYRLIGNTRLRSESTKQVNLGTTWHKYIGKGNDYLTLSADVYYNRVKDKIVAIPTMFVWQMSNVGKVETIGADINIGGEVSIFPQCKAHFNANYNFMQAEDISNSESALWRDQIAYTPKHSGAGNCNFEFPWFTIGYNVTWAGERYAKAQNSPDNRIKPYADHSINLSKRFEMGRHSLYIQADARNLGGKNYEIIRFYPMPGRNYNITLNYNI